MTDVMNILSFLAFLGIGNPIGLPTLVTHLEEAIDRLWNLDGKAAMIRTWVEGALLGEIGAFFHIGMFGDPNVVGVAPWYITGLALGVVLTVGVNIAFAKVPFLKAYLEKLGIRVPADAPQVAPLDPTRTAPLDPK